MNSNQKIHFEYGRQMLEGKREASDVSKRTGGHEDKLFGEWLVAKGLHIDPITRKEASRPIRAACIWAAEDEERFKRYTEKYSGHTVRSLHTLYKAEQRGDTCPSVYVYRMQGPVSGELLEPNICKIGSAKNGAKARVAEQSRKAAVGYFPKIEMELKCQEPARLEELLHKRFSSKKVKVPGREWFQVSLEDVEVAIQEMESDGLLWRDGSWIYMGQKLDS